MRPLQLRGMFLPGLRLLGGAAAPGNVGKVAERLQQEPAEPYALALARLADAVHAVVPVAAEDQRQAVGAGPRHREIEGPHAMVVDRGASSSDTSGAKKASCCPGASGSPFDEGDLLVRIVSSPVVLT